MTETLRRTALAVTLLAGAIAANHQAVVLARAIATLRGHL